MNIKKVGENKYRRKSGLSIAKVLFVLLLFVAILFACINIILNV